MNTDKPLLGKKIAVLVETEYIYDEIEYYLRRVPELGGEVTLLTYLWGEPSKDLVNDIDSPDRPVTDVHRLTVTECVTQHNPIEYDVVICAANYVAVRLREVPPTGSLASPELTRSAPSVQFFARAMENHGIVKAAMCHALWILTPRPDLLKNRRIICHTVVLADIHNAGAVYIPAPTHVVVDRDLVTARSFADIGPYFDAIVDTVLKVPARAEVQPESANNTLERTVAAVVSALEDRFSAIPANGGGTFRPVSRAAGALLDGSLNIADEVKRMTGVDFDSRCPAQRKPILLVASKFGVWASEVSLVAGTLLKAGYKVEIATEDGSPPHLLGPSLDLTFSDGAWRCSVVSPEERDLALKFLNPTSQEHALLKKENIVDLSQLAKPPQVGDYLKDHALLGEYSKALRKSIEMSNEYEAIIIAGGSGAIPGFMADRGLQSLILAFYKLGKPVMAECNGGLAIAQTIDPDTGKSILAGHAVTTHSWLDEYQSGWGWTAASKQDSATFWSNGQFDLKAYQAAETWETPGIGGNPLIDSEAMFKNAAGDGGVFFSPPGTPYSVVVDNNLITCRTTPDGYPGVLALMAVMDGRPALRGRLYIDADERGRSQPTPPGLMPKGWTWGSPLDAAREGDLATLTRWLTDGGDPDISDRDGWTPLLIAAARGHAEVVDLLLWHEIPGVRRANPENRFPGADALPIYMAGQSADIPTVRTLLRARPSHLFDVATVNGHTVLLQAAFYGQKRHQALANFLLENIAGILSIPKGNEAAILAARKRLMMATNVRGQNPLALAKAYDIRPMVQLLEKFDTSAADDQSGYYRRLLERIAPPAPRTPTEQRAQTATDRLIDVLQHALDHAAVDATLSAAELLGGVSKLISVPNLEVNRLGGPLQRTPLITACTGADTNQRMADLRADFVDLLIKHGADPLIHEVHAMGVNAVVRAAVWGHLYILEHFAAVLSTDVLAAALNEKPLVNGFTALHDSVLRALSAQGDRLEQYLSQIGWLVQHGAEYNIEDHSGWTQEAIVRAALDDPDFRDNAIRVQNALVG